MGPSGSVCSVLQVHLRIQSRRTRLVHAARCERECFVADVSEVLRTTSKSPMLVYRGVLRSDVSSQQGVVSFFFLKQRACSSIGSGSVSWGCRGKEGTCAEVDGFVSHGSHKTASRLHHALESNIHSVPIRPSNGPVCSIDVFAQQQEPLQTAPRSAS